MLQAWASKSQQERHDWLLWGLHRTSVAIAFIDDSAGSTHGSIRPNATFISPSEEWKLGGFEVLSNPKGDNPGYTMGASLLPGSMSSVPPEVKKSGWSAFKDPVSAVDGYPLGLLLHSVFNPAHPSLETAESPHPPPQPTSALSRGSIPPSVFPSFKRLLNPNPNGLRACSGLDNFSLASESDKAMLLRVLKESGSSFPPEFGSFRILPSLVTALEYGGASAVTIVPLILQLFARPDRGTRIALLHNFAEYVDRLDKKGVTEKIWPNLQSGFTDTVPVIRGVTIRAIVLLSPEQKVLVPSFSKALKHSFVHARVAGLVAFTATGECFNAEDVAAKVISNIAMELFMKRLETHADSVPEAALVDSEAGLVNSATGAGGIRWMGHLSGKSLLRAICRALSLMPRMSLRSTDLAQPKGLRLGSKMNGSSVAAQLAEQIVAEEGKINSWGNDLMDVNADEGDWSAFKSAPEKFTSTIELRFRVSIASPPQGKDEWGDMDTGASPSDTAMSTLLGSPQPPSRTLTPQHHIHPHARKTTHIPAKPAKPAVVSPVSSSRSTPMSSPPLLAELESLSKSTVGISKEEKASEMARRKEERRLSISTLATTIVAY
ncbi:other/SCY1 protein kinase [Chiua virens]|nr:other/SCY1 protein kinase [Chiua virens]